MPDDTPYSESLVGPEGEPLTRRACHAAILWLRAWNSGPAQPTAALAMRNRMLAVLGGWPGEVCPGCYLEWDGSLD